MWGFTEKEIIEVSCFTLPNATAEFWQGLCKLLEYPGVSTSQHPLLILWELLLGNCWPTQTHNCIHPSSMSPSNEAILVYNCILTRFVLIFSSLAFFLLILPVRFTHYWLDWVCGKEGLISCSMGVFLSVSWLMLQTFLRTAVVNSLCSAAWIWLLVTSTGKQWNSILSLVVKSAGKANVTVFKYFFVWLFWADWILSRTWIHVIIILVWLDAFHFNIESSLLLAAFFTWYF